MAVAIITTTMIIVMPVSITMTIFAPPLSTSSPTR